MTLPNRISILRLLLIPVCIAGIVLYRGEEQWPRVMALAVYVIAALSDAVDGYIARRYNQSTKLGRVLDPLADKLLVNLTFIFLAVNPHFATQVPLWLPVFLVGRDAFITGGSFLIKRAYGEVEIRPKFSGKLNTVIECVAAIGVLFEFRYAAFLLVALVAVGVISWLDYLVEGIVQARRKASAV
jgi:cardiolipin synthase